MYYIGVDLGGTNIAVGIVDEDCRIVKKTSTPTLPERGADAIIEDMAKCAKNLLLELNIPLSEVASAGVATPGTADTENQVVVYANNIPFKDYPLGSKLSSLLGGIPVYIENDANAAAKAEAFAGAAKDAKISVLITLGTGLGGGIVIDGAVYSGFNFAGAELGHTVIEKGGRQCSCGRKGCWEAYSSATGLVNITKDRIAEAKEKGIPSIIYEMVESEGKVSARTAFNAMKKGDALGKEIVDEYIDYLACGIANIINIFQPNVLSIGGGVCNEGDNLLIPLKEKVFYKETYTKEGFPSTEIKVAELGNDAGIIGAAVLGR